MLTGLLLQLAVGPVFFYIMGITIDSNYLNGLAAIIAVTLADYIYIVLSLVGLGRLLQKGRIRTAFGLVGSVVLVLFGLMVLYKGLAFIDATDQTGVINWTPLNSFTSAFILTISSPLTIVFWSSVFSAKAIEMDYKRKELIIFGFGTGLSTLFFMSSTMAVLSLLKSDIPTLAIQILNCLVGLVLIYYGISRTVKTLRGPF